MKAKSLLIFVGMSFPALATGLDKLGLWPIGAIVIGAIGVGCMGVYAHLSDPNKRDGTQG